MCGRLGTAARGALQDTSPPFTSQGLSVSAHLPKRPDEGQGADLRGLNSTLRVPLENKQKKLFSEHAAQKHNVVQTNTQSFG